MTELKPEGRVEVRPDGSKVFTHGHRFPDNTQVVTQEYDSQGKLRTVKAQWTGFAGRVLDVTATLDDAGKVVKEEGYRAPDATMPVTDLIKPLPAGEGSASSSAAVPAMPDAPITVPDLGGGSPSSLSVAAPSIRDGLRAIYGTQGKK